MIASFLLFATIVLLGAPAAIVFIPWTVITRDASALYKVSLLIIRAACSLAGVRTKAIGREGIPHTACIFMANHTSNLDPVVLFPLIPGRTSALIKSSLMRIPVLGWGLSLAKFVPVERAGRVESAQENVAAARRVLASGIHITTFVEGTRSLDGRLLPFKKGPFYLAMDAGVPCIPVTITGAQSMMTKGSLRIRPGTACVHFHAPIRPQDHAAREDLVDAVRAAIASGLPESLRS
jgi:1-acyl-sn-glycerol-3-phosphate acyltransferase